MSNFSLKYFILLFLIAFTLQTPFKDREWDKRSREFLTSYFTTILGEETDLDNDCLSGQFDTLLDQLDSSILKFEIKEVLELSINILSVEFNKCPFKISETIFIDFMTAVANGSFAYNNIRYSNYIYTTIKDYIVDSEKIPSELGKLIGKLARITIYGAPSFETRKNSLKFLH